VDERVLSPKDDAGWEALVTAASTVAESGNALQLTSRARPHGGGRP
jgi:hypothetical protein